ncbi:bactofilin family protein [Arenibaculum pallidiluteum]|uniref:bactofilin family protein n=1 Tax=Arenibaculum pallidiluteum TaxID=2812559 RepID=UPI001F3C5772|nr:polymer-forming cytoskeletal protein [Arenibaculum pallidiluteum]
MPIKTDSLASEPTPRSPFADKGPEMNPISKPPAPPAPTAPSSLKQPEVPRRVVDIPGTPPRRAGLDGPGSLPGQATDTRKLIVGRDISLSGEIAACDVLVVEGTVEARLKDGRSIEIAETGLFKGSVEIDEADIAGRFEGDITVRGRLRVRSSGRINGSIRYGELEVEAGGRLKGDIQVIEAGSAPKAVPAAPAAAPAAPFVSVLADGTNA